jgi:ubiquinone/menaquinone biosynthesis C-methylase UbiE
MAMQGFRIKEAILERWDCSAATYDDHHGHGIKSAEERRAWKTLLAGVLGERALSILDVGCGTGEISLLLAEMGHAVTGLDLSDKMLDRARLKAESAGYTTVFRNGDAENPPFADGIFDVIINRHVLWTLPNPQTAVQSWNRVLKPGGKAVIIDGIWNDGSLGTRMRRLISNAMVLVLERVNPVKSRYSDDLSQVLPNSGGTPPERAREYLSDAGFRNIDLIDLINIRNIQKKKMPFRKRIVYNYCYYLISGEK